MKTSQLFKKTHHKNNYYEIQQGDLYMEILFESSGIIRVMVILQ